MEDKKKLSKIIFNPKVRDFTYLILFFFTLSIFIFFAIRPAIVSIFSLTREAEDLKKINNLYNQKIDEIVFLQSQLEGKRDDLFYLIEAIPNFVQINKRLEDIKTASAKSSVSLKSFSFSDINLTSEQKDEVRSIVINTEIEGNFENLMSFIKEMISQRRLKKIDKITITKPEPAATSSSQLKVNLMIEGYYL
jgi:Tfp pilus assembly protein PilO